MKRIMTVVGARPQFIKAGVVSRALLEYDNFDETLVDTGQHYDDAMNRIFFEELNIPRPKYFLNVGSGMHGAQTGQMLASLERTMIDERPDLVLVYGDTNSTLAAAIAAAKLHIPIAHVEAGLRSFNRLMPEEINRVLTDHASSILFAPTQSAIKNLHNEGIPDMSVHFVGDVMFDSALYFSNKTTKIIERLSLNRGKYVLATVHRAENTDDSQNLRIILQAIEKISSFERVILPLHPRTRKFIDQYGYSGLLGDAVEILPPLGYLDMLTLEQSARVIVTDSGGVQKEAFFQGVPCITLRDQTEWTELVEHNWNRLISPLGVDEIVSAVKDAGLGDKDISLYGNGLASQLIAKTLTTIM